MLVIMFPLHVWIASLLFALAHSLLASAWCKRLFYQLGLTPQHYRRLYSLLALLLTLLWLFYIYRLPDKPLYHVEGWLSGLLIAVQFCGAWVVLLALQSFDAALFLGIKPVTGHKEPFHEHGIYRHIRHPMYSGFMLILFASPVQSVNSLNLAIAVTLYFLLGSRFEERRMLLMHPEYTDYRKRVPAFLPWRALFRSPRGPQ